MGDLGHKGEEGVFESKGDFEGFTESYTLGTFDLDASEAEVQGP
jgi:hypothetical protein